MCNWAHVDSDRGHGCYRPGGFHRWNEWRRDVESWMTPENLPHYRDLIERGNFRDAHQMTKSAFAIYCHQLAAGRKYVLHMLVQLPILAQSSATTRLWCSCRFWYQFSQNGSLICNEISKLKNPKRRCGNQSRRSPPTTVVASAYKSGRLVGH